MRQQYYVHNDILHSFACAIIYSAYNDYEIAKRGMIRCFKKRHKYYDVKLKFKTYMYDYRELKRFFRDNIWFDYLGINPEYFKRLMEDKKHDNSIKTNQRT